MGHSDHALTRHNATRLTDLGTYLA
jgi:hypothetical protein